MNAKQKKLDKEISLLSKRKETPETKKAINKLKREYNQVWKDELVKYIGKKIDGMVDYQSFLEYCLENNISHSLPGGFTGYIDKDRKWYTVDEDLVNGAPNSFMFPTVKMNPSFDKESSPWVFVAIRQDGTQGNYFYCKSFVKEQRNKKFMNVRSLLDCIDKVRAKWLKLINEFDESNPDSVAAVVLELLFQFSARIGSDGNGTREGKKTYGIVTLRRKHVRDCSKGLIFRYLGKDAVKTKHIWFPSDKQKHDILCIISDLLENKNPSDFVFTYRCKNGKRKPIQPSVVNRLFKKLGAGDCTVHKLRTYHATALAERLIEEMFVTRKKFMNEKKAAEALVKIAEKVGKQLNHVRRTKEGRQKVTGMTALNNYIDTILQKKFYEHYKIPFPKYLEKML